MMLLPPPLPTTLPLHRHLLFLPFRCFTEVRGMVVVMVVVVGEDKATSVTGDGGEYSARFI